MDTLELYRQKIGQDKNHHSFSNLIDGRNGNEMDLSVVFI